MDFDAGDIFKIDNVDVDDDELLMINGISYRTKGEKHRLSEVNTPSGDSSLPQSKFRQIVEHDDEGRNTYQSTPTQYEEHDDLDDDETDRKMINMHILQNMENDKTQRKTRQQILIQRNEIHPNMFFVPIDINEE